MLPEAALASLVATLFSMMNPLGNVGVFAGMTAGRHPADQRIDGQILRPHAIQRGQAPGPEGWVHQVAL